MSNVKNLIEKYQHNFEDKLENMTAYAHKLISLIVQDRKPILYQGKVLYLRAGKHQGSSIAALNYKLKREENQRCLQTMFSNLQVVNFSYCNHEDLFNNQSMNQIYTKLLLQFLQENNS